MLTTLKVSSLPDNGMKLQNKIAELEQEINNLKLSRNVDGRYLMCCVVTNVKAFNFLSIDETQELNNLLIY